MPGEVLKLYDYICVPEVTSVDTEEMKINQLACTLANTKKNTRTRD